MPPSWELAAPNGMLVSVVITYVIWPTFLRETGPSATVTLRSAPVLMAHCGNTIFIVLEMLIGRSPICWNHAGVAPILGLIYVLFAWTGSPFLAPKYGAQYL